MIAFMSGLLMSTNNLVWLAAFTKRSLEIEERGSSISDCVNVKLRLLSIFLKQFVPLSISLCGA